MKVNYFNNDFLAVTTQEISGACIPTIPAGTIFTVQNVGEMYSSCSGIPINQIWNDEYTIVMNNDFSI